MRKYIILTVGIFVSLLLNGKVNVNAATVSKTHTKVTKNYVYYSTMTRINTADNVKKITDWVYHKKVKNDKREDITISAEKSKTYTFEISNTLSCGVSGVIATLEHELSISNSASVNVTTSTAVHVYRNDPTGLYRLESFTPGYKVTITCDRVEKKSGAKKRISESTAKFAPKRNGAAYRRGYKKQ